MQISHRVIQIFLKKTLAPEEIWIEKPFPSVSRVADVVWPAQKLIFEIQCSPIRVKEIQARNQAYQKLGYTVIWILHDRCFNRAYITPAERFLRFQTHYFTNINALGHGEIYDQYATLRRGRRVKRTPRYPIKLNQPVYLKQIPRHFPKERQHWTYQFDGDFFSQPFQPLQTSKFLSLYRLFIELLLKKMNH